MRIIGTDIHRVAAEVVALVDGQVRRLGRVPMLRMELEDFAREKLMHTDHMVIEATGNAATVVEVLAPFVVRLVVANPKQVHMIAHAKIKTDAIDAAVLAKFYATGFLPKVWVTDGQTLALRRQVARRAQLMRQRVRLKNLIQSVLHAHLVPTCPHGNLVGMSGRVWIAKQRLPQDERDTTTRHLSLIDLIEASLKRVNVDIARSAMSYPSLDDVARRRRHRCGRRCRCDRRHPPFRRSRKLVGYLGLNPSVHQSGEGPANHGRITKQGRGQARGMLVEAALAPARSPGPLRAFDNRIAARRNKHIAAVATARKIAMIIWHMLTKETDYIFVHPALLARKFRSIELRAGPPAEHAKRGIAYGYNIPDKRAAERAMCAAAERDYGRFTSR